MEIMRSEGHIMPPEGCIMQPEGDIMFPEGLHNFHWPDLPLYVLLKEHKGNNYYTVRRPVICKVLKIRIWGVPPACLGSRYLQ